MNALKGIYMKAELQKGGILVSRIPDISGRKSGHFQIVDINLTYLALKGYNTVYLRHNSTWNEYLDE